MEPTVVTAPPVTSADFVAMYTRYHDHMINYLKQQFRLTAEQAEDCAQDAFLKAWRMLANGAVIDANGFSAWLYRIAVNTGIDVVRRRRLITWLSLASFGDERGEVVGLPLADTTFERQVAEYDLVHRVLGKLPAIFIPCLLLKEHEGYSCDEIAVTLGLTPNAVKMRLMRARRQFIELYKQEVA